MATSLRLADVELELGRERLAEHVAGAGAGGRGVGVHDQPGALHGGQGTPPATLAAVRPTPWSGRCRRRCSRTPPSGAPAGVARGRAGRRHGGLRRGDVVRRWQLTGERTWGAVAFVAGRPGAVGARAAVLVSRRGAPPATRAGRSPPVLFTQLMFGAVASRRRCGGRPAKVPRARRGRTRLVVLRSCSSAGE